MNLNKLLAVGFASLALMLVACGGQSEVEQLASAKQQLAKQDYPAAAITLKAVLQQHPDSAEGRFLLGLTLLEQGDAKAALLQLVKAKDLNHSDDLVVPKLALAMIASDRAVEAIQTYSKTTLQSKSAQGELQTALAIALSLLNKRIEAEAAIAEALELTPTDARTILTKARMLAAAGKFEESLNVAAKAVVPGEPSGEAHMLRGQLLRHFKKDLDAAAAAYVEAAKDRRMTVQAKGALIQLEVSRNRIKEARQLLTDFQKSHAKSVPVILLDGIVSYSEGQYARAEAIGDELLRLVPTNAQLLVLAGASSLKAGNLLAAETKLGRLVQTVEGVPTARNLLAETYIRLGQPDKALSTLRPLLELAKPDAAALALAGQAHLHRGHLAEAEASFAAAAKINPKDVKLEVALALTDLARGNSTSAFGSLQEIAARDQGDAADLAMISARLKRREFDAALVAAGALEKKAPGKLAATHLRGVILRGKGDAVAARAAFEQALMQQPGHWISVAALAEMDAQESKLDSAASRLKAVIEAQPRNVSARMAMLEVMRLKGESAEVRLGVIEDAIKTNPTEPTPRVAKISELMREKRVKDAALAAQAAMAALPSNPDVLHVAGQALGASGDDQQAISAFNKLAAAAPASPLAHIRLADLYLKRGDLSAVAASLARALEVAPASTEVHQRLLSQAQRTKDLKRVTGLAIELQKRQPNSSIGFLLEGDAEATVKNWGAALNAYRRATKVRDIDRRAPQALYLALNKSGDQAGADRFAAEFQKAHPKDVDWLKFLGGVALSRSDKALAERLYREAVALRPDDPSALNNLAWLVADRGDKAAVALGERALSLAPASPAVMDTLAKAFAIEGRIEEALQLQKRAIGLAPEQPLYQLGLARLLAKAGRPTEGLAVLSRMGEPAPGSLLREEVDKVRKLLSSKP